jgi:hypothetical protein
MTSAKIENIVLKYGTNICLILLNNHEENYSYIIYLRN